MRTDLIFLALGPKCDVENNLHNRERRRWRLYTHAVRDNISSKEAEFRETPSEELIRTGNNTIFIAQSLFHFFGVAPVNLEPTRFRLSHT